MRRRCAHPPLLCGGGSHSLRGARHRQWRRALSARGHRRVVASFGAVGVALLSRRCCARRRWCASRARFAAASDAAALYSAAAPLRRWLALSAWCTSSSSGACSLQAAAGESVRPSGRSLSHCSRGAAVRGTAFALLASVVPPHPMRRCCARPPLLCGDGLRSLRSALVVIRGARSLQTVVSESSRPLGRSQSRRFRGAAARGAACARFASAVPPRPMRRRCARPPLLCGSGSHSLRGVIIASGGARSLRAVIGELPRPLGRSPSRCSRGAAARGAARALLAFAVPPHPMRRCCARPPLHCGGGSRSLRSALVVSGSARSLRAAVGGSSRPLGRLPSRRFHGAATCGAARACCARAMTPRLMRRRCTGPPLLCRGGSHSPRSARRRQATRALCGRPSASCCVL